MNVYDVVLPNGKIITSTHEIYLNIPQYPKAARNAHILLALSHDVSTSISQLCDEDYISVFNKKEINFVKDGSIYIIDQRHPRTKLYMLHLNDISEPGSISREIKQSIEATTNKKYINTYAIKNKTK